MEKKYQDIDDSAVTSAKDFLRGEAKLVEDIQLVDDERVFERLGFSSLFSYCVERLKLSESNAYAFISVARKAKKVPLLKEAVSQGTLTVSQAKRIVSVIQPENAEDWIRTAQNEKQKDLEKLVAKELPEPPPSGKIKRVGGEMSELKLVIPEKLREKLTRLMDVRGAQMLDALDFALEQALERHDPMRKAARNHGKTKKSGATPKSPSSRKAHGRTKPVAAVLHEVTLRDLGQCIFTRPDGTRCGNRRYVQKHHVDFVSRGGANTASNLVLLCSAHHGALHKGLISLKGIQGGSAELAVF